MCVIFSIFTLLKIKLNFSKYFIKDIKNKPIRCQYKMYFQEKYPHFPKQTKKGINEMNDIALHFC